MFKDDLRKSVLDRLGGFEDSTFYQLATILDPRWKTSFFNKEATAAEATGKLIQETQKVMDSLQEMGPVRKDPPSPDPIPSSSTSILAQIKKKIKLDKAETEEEQSTVAKVVQDYLKLPQEENHVLR